MDDVFFQRRQDMSQEQLQSFAQNRLHMEVDNNEYMERNVNMQMTADELQENYGRKQNTSRRFAPVKLDMPPQDADEKESTRKRRERRTLIKQAKAMHRFDEMRERTTPSMRYNWDGEAFYSIRLQEDHFSPQYAFEHYAEIRQELISIKEQLDFDDKNLKEFGPDGANGRGIIFSLEGQIRHEKMKVMYENAERALESAIGARGYTCLKLESGEYRFVESQEPNNIENSMEANLEARKNLRKIAKNMDEEVADQLMEEMLQQMEPQFAESHEDVKSSLEYYLIPPDNVTHLDQMEALTNMRRTISGHPDKYKENQEVIDKMYREVFDLMNANGLFSRYSQALTELNFNSSMSTLKKTRSILRERQAVYDKKKDLIQSRANYILEGVECLLNIKTRDALSERAKLTLNEFMKQPDDVIQARNAAEATASVYARKLEEKKNIFEDLGQQIHGEGWKNVATEENRRYLRFMESGNHAHKHNLKIIQMLGDKYDMEVAIRECNEHAQELTARFEHARKEIATHYLDKMRDFDTKDLESCTDEELLARMEELQELSIQGEQMIEAAKYKDPDDSHGRTIMENYFRDDNNSRMLFDLKCSIVQSYALRARSLAMIKAYEKDALTPSCLSEDAITDVINANSLKRDNEITRQQLLTYAKRMLEHSEAMKDAAYNRYYHTDEIRNKHQVPDIKFKPGEVYGHAEFQKKLAEANQKGIEELKRQEGMEEKLKDQTSLNEDTIPIYYAILKERLNKIEEEEKKEGLEANSDRANDLEEEFETLTERIEYLQVLYGLSSKCYGLSDGTGNQLIPEALFRSYGAIESQPSFHGMSDKEFDTMCKQLSAGALDHKTASEKKLKEYRAENVKGLLTYKKHMSEHYEMLEELLHHRIPSLVYIEKHREELIGYFKNLQVDLNLVEHSKDMIDMEKPEDQRLYHLVNVYHEMGPYIKNIGLLLSSNTMRDYKEVVEEQKSIMRNAQASFDYLDAHYR